MLLGLGACVFANAAWTAPAKAAPLCMKGQLSTRAKPCRKATPAVVVKPNCPVVSATGVLGVTTIGIGGTTATPLGSKATAGVLVDCAFLAETLEIQVPGHSVGVVDPTEKSDLCTQAADTITCKLNEVGEHAGLKAAGAWNDTINWTFAPHDTATTNTSSGTCGMNVVVTLLTGGIAQFTKSTTTACG